MRLERNVGQLILLVLILGSILMGIPRGQSTNNSTQLIVESHEPSAGLINHDLISIQGNKDFLLQAEDEGWSGSGSASDPIVITGYHFVNSKYLLRIVDTTLHFCFKKNVLDGVDRMWNGLYLSNVSNAEIVNNTFMNTRIGIYASKTQQSVITENIMKNNDREGIYLEDDSRNNVISENIISHNSYGGVSLKRGARYNILKNNIIRNNEGFGIRVNHDAVGTVIRNNIIVDNRFTGISILESHTAIIDNVVVSNQNGISVSGDSCNISRNQIFCNSRSGVKVYSYSSGCVISQNSFIYNQHYGVALSSTCHDIRVTENDFLLNWYSPQALDRGKENTFSSNYWNPWNLSEDGYALDGEAENTDWTPATEPNRQVPEWLELEPNTSLGNIYESTGFMSTSIMAILLAYLASLLILDSREKSIIINMQ